MTAITIEVLKKIIEHMPEDYTVEFDKGKDIVKIDDKVEIDVNIQKLILTVLSINRKFLNFVKS